MSFTADAFLEILDDKRVIEKFHDVFGSLIDLMVEEKVKVIKQDLEEMFQRKNAEKDKKEDEMKAEIESLKADQSKMLQYSYREDLILKGVKIEQS